MQIDAIAGYLNSRTATGEQLYVSRCAGCHGNDGRGGRVGEGVRGESANSITEAIREKGSMQFLGCLSPADIQLTATFLSGGKPGNDSSGGDGGGGGGTSGTTLLGLLGLGLYRGRKTRTRKPIVQESRIDKLD